MVYSQAKSGGWGPEELCPRDDPQGVGHVRGAWAPVPAAPGLPVGPAERLTSVPSASSSLNHVPGPWTAQNNMRKSSQPIITTVMAIQVTPSLSHFIFHSSFFFSFETQLKPLLKIRELKQFAKDPHE